MHTLSTLSRDGQRTTLTGSQSEPGTTRADGLTVIPSRYVGTVKSWEFWAERADNDPWTSSTMLNEELLESVVKGTIPSHPDVELAVALARFTHQQFENYGTSGSELSPEQSILLMKALMAVLRRLGITGFTPPFRDFDSFYRHWKREGATGSYQARRDILHEVFEPLHVTLAEREAGSITSTLAVPVSPHKTTGWPLVDEEISELRRHFESASSQQDHSNIGNDCVAILEALSETVYNHARHGRSGEEEPPVASTKNRLDRFIEVEIPGKTNAELRKLTRAAIELAQAVKHRRATLARLEAGIAADSVILLANVLRRIQLSG